MAVARKVKIGEFRNRVSSYIRRVERGETISIMRRNREVALLLPPERRGAPERLLGCLEGTARALGNIDEIRIPEEEWFRGS
jgi:prevent-host-death family protein